MDAWRYLNLALDWLDRRPGWQIAGAGVLFVAIVVWAIN